MSAFFVVKLFHIKYDKRIAGAEWEGRLNISPICHIWQITHSLKCNILRFVEVYYANEHTIQNDWLIRNEAAKVRRMGV